MLEAQIVVMRTQTTGMNDSLPNTEGLANSLNAMHNFKVWHVFKKKLSAQYLIYHISIVLKFGHILVQQLLIRDIFEPPKISLGLLRRPVTTGVYLHNIPVRSFFGYTWRVRLAVELHLLMKTIKSTWHLSCRCLRESFRYPHTPQPDSSWKPTDDMLFGIWQI